MAEKIRNITSNAMVHLFLKNYNIPTRKDIDKILTRLDRIEQMVQAINRRGSLAGPLPGQTKITALNTVLEVIKEYKDGIDFAEIQRRTGFNDKKIRNIIFRLNKLGKIKRIHRGIYVAQA